MQIFVKTLLIILYLTGFQLQSSAQNKLQTNPEKSYPSRAHGLDSILIATNNALYALGTEINDNNLRETALANLLSYNPEDTLVLYNLVKLYFDTKSNLQAFLLAKKYLNSDRDNLTLLEYYSKSAELLGKFGDAVTGYKKLYVLTDDIYYGYLHANVLWAMGKYNESNTVAKKVLEKFETLKVYRRTITLGGAPGESPQSVPLKAAIFEVIGLNYLYLKDKELARQAILSALKEFPDFAEAKQNLALIK